jgi:NADP-dependent 3-hydroxy acid dehydrogenase YdfG
MTPNAVRKVAIVTGSTQGLGQAITRRLVDEALIGGLVICGRSTENGQQLAREFSARGQVD